MMDRPGGKKRLHTQMAVVVAWAMSVLSTSALAQDVPFISDDIRLTAPNIQTFQDDQDQVSVLPNGFELVMGKRQLSGDQAVIWIRPFKPESAMRRDITVYIKGNARAIEPNGTVTADKTMLVTLHQQGRLTAVGKVAPADLKDDPFYVAAVAVRQRVAAGGVATTGAATSAAASGEEPTVLVPAVEGSRPAVPSGDANLVVGGVTPTSQPGGAATPVAAGGRARPSASPLAGTGVTPKRAGKKAASKPTVTGEVTFHHPDNLKLEETEPGKHQIIARGNIYVTQGNPKSELFLEMRSQVAVVYTEIPPADAKSRFPNAPKIIGVPSGKAGQSEVVSGVYLEGDVIIARGDRTMRAPAAYYDFIHNKALVLDPVFRTIQEQRNIPIYVRAKEGRILSPTEYFFKDAKVTSSDFYSPEYAIGASSIFLEDKTQYDATGTRISERTMYAKMRNETFEVQGLPLLYWPYSEGDFTEGTTALRRASIGSLTDLGTGVQTEWDLFRLLGLLKPEGVKAWLDLEAYAHGDVAGMQFDYARQVANRQYSGYSKFYGVLDRSGQDTFGQDNTIDNPPEDRGRVLIRHKELLPKDIELQFELSYLSDRNFLEKYFPNEYFAGKEQETLLYAKKQQDNWALTSLLQYRLNNFQSQSESFPDLGFYLLGQPLLGDHLSFFSENHLGVKKYAFDKDLTDTDDQPLDDSKVFGRADSRNEIDLPLHLGPINLVPYGVVRGTYWGSTPKGINAQPASFQPEEEPIVTDENDGGSLGRPYGETGLTANTHIWRVFEDVNNRLWDINQLRHIMTPQVAGFVSGDGGVTPSELYPLDPGIEENLGQINGGSFALYQRLQTKRGPDNHVVDWMRLNVIAGFYDTDLTTPPADGRFFMSRPEYSIPRDHVNAEYAWNISDSFSFLSDVNYDVESSGVGVADAGVAITRDPRLRYYLGWRFIRDLNASVGTIGANYKLNRKYTISVFEQYDFDYNGGENLATSMSIIRKFPRWYGSFTFSFDQRTGDTTVMVSFWPEGVPEVHLNGGRMSLLGSSSQN